MKVLWFSNTPANADEYYNSELKDTGGWLKSLDLAVQDKLELHVAFYASEDSMFKHKNTTYHSIQSPGVMHKIASRLWGKVLDQEDLGKYFAIIEKVKPDIIHIHGTENPFGCIIPHCNIPAVVSIQGNITVCHHKFFSGFEKKYLKTTIRESSSLKRLVASQSFWGSYKSFERMQVIEKRNLSNTKFVMGRTEWDKRVTRILAPDSIYYHGDEILRASFLENQWTPRLGHKITLHTTSGNNIYKGFETLCESLHLLNSLGIECEWRVAGIKPSDLIVKLTRKKLKNKFPQKGLNLMGSLNEKELVESLLGADMYVMVSHIENSPNNLCEAMILGMPCISTFVGGTGSLIIDDEEGILIQSGDPWAMAGAVLELSSDKDKTIKLGQNARKKALVRHDKERVTNILLLNYINIIEHHKTETNLL